jgi:hypothetical protein
MFFRSFFYERTVLSLVEKVQRLPPNVQTEIAVRLRKYINLARSAKDEASLVRVATATGQERERLIAQGAKSPVDHDGLHWRLPRHGASRCSVYPTAA